MFKKKMATVIVGIALALGAVLLFSACNKSKSAATGGTAGSAADDQAFDSAKYSGLLKGDFSVVAGTYVSESGDRIKLDANGSILTRKDGKKFEATAATYTNVANWNKAYYWGNFPGGEARGSDFVLWPVGVDIFADGKLVKTDKTKERLISPDFIEFEGSPSASELPSKLYYRETSGTTAPFETPETPYEMPTEAPFQAQFAGTYVNADGDKKQIEANGAVNGCRFVGFFLYTGGIYELRYWIGQDYSSINIVPVGVDVYDWDGKLLKTDKTKIRLSPSSRASSNDELYYPQTSGIYYATTNLRLRSEPDTSKDNRIAGVSQGNRVELLEVGKTETIDGITAPWFKVKTVDGTEGWLFSGYLTETAPAN
ncbi:hypothetical protein R84B8_03074 [Treponema sp. R8-4-B8]